MRESERSLIFCPIPAPGWIWTSITDTISLMNARKSRVLADLQDKKLLKVIAGINNYDKARVLQIVKASNAISASCVDICDSGEIIKEARQLTQKTALFVSSVELEKLEKAVGLGVDAIELGNFEALYKEGIYYSATEVLEMAKEIMNFKKDLLVSITVPGHLAVVEQVTLAEELEKLGVDMIQTEGASLVDTNKAAALGQIEKVRLTLANTMELAKVLEKTFIITASGISPDTAKLAIAAGANGIGVGKYVNQLESDLEILAAITALKTSLEESIQKFSNTSAASLDEFELILGQ